MVTKLYQPRIDGHTISGNDLFTFKELVRLTDSLSYFDGKYTIFTYNVLDFSKDDVAKYRNEQIRKAVINKLSLEEIKALGL